MPGRTTSPAKREAADQQRAELLAQLSDGIDALCETDEWERYLKVQAAFRHYSFANTMLITIQRPLATQVASAKAWEKTGRQLREGERSRPIRIWAPGSRPKAAEAAPVEDQGEQPQPSRKGYATRFVLVPVYDVAQTEGQELPEPVKLLDGADETGIFGGLVKVAGGLGYTVEVTPEIDGYPGANGLCQFGLRRLTVAGNRSPLQQVKSLTHELAHALLHEPEDHGEGQPPRFAQDRGLRELEAESGAYVVCQSLGLDTSDYSFGYVAGWQGGSPRKTRNAIKASGRRIAGAAKTITEALEATREGEHQDPAPEAQTAPVADHEIEAA